MSLTKNACPAGSKIPSLIIKIPPPSTKETFTITDNLWGAAAPFFMENIPCSNRTFPIYRKIRRQRSRQEPKLLPNSTKSYT